MKHTTRTFLVALAVVVVLTGCTQTSPTATPTTEARPTTVPPTSPPPSPSATPVPPEKVFRYASFEPDSLDPSKGGRGFEDYQLLYEALVDSYASDGEILPLAAESFDFSADGLSVTFTLRPGLKWSDGVPLVAEDYRYAWLRQLDPAEASYEPEAFFAIKNAKAFNLGEIEDRNMVGIQAPDDRTLVVTLEAPAPYFLRYVGSTSYFPVRKDVLEKYGDQWMEAGNFVSNGAYMLDEWKHDQRMVFVRNPHYAGPWKDTRLVDRIETTIIQDPWSQAVPGYEAGELDIAIVPSTDLPRIQDHPEMSQQLHKVTMAAADILVFDTKNAPTSDVRVRQALQMAIDREALANDVLRGAYAPGTSFSPPALASYNPDTYLGYDVAAAKQLLADAGFPDGEGFPVASLTHWTSERASLTCQAIAAMWKENLGIEVTVEPLEPAAMRDYRNSRATQPFNFYYASQGVGILDPVEWHNSQLDPDSNVRHSRYDDAEYVKLIRDAAYEGDPAKRDAMWKEAEAIANRDVPMISLCYSSRNYLVKPYIVGFDNVVTSVSSFVQVGRPPGLDVTQ